MSIEINNLELSKSVQIYKKIENLSINKIKNIFINLSSRKKGNYVINKIKEEYLLCENTYFSVMSFKFEEEPSFLVNTEVSELKYAYIIITENDNYIFISKKNISGIEKELEGYIDYFDYEKFTHFRAEQDTKYEKISMGNMTISEAVIRSRSYEADNLNGIMPLSSSSRSVPRNIRISQYGEIFSITPNTSRIGQKSNKVKIVDYISWCIEILSDIENDSESEFINGFAKPTTLQDIMTNAYPIGILFHFHNLENDIENGTIALYSLDENSLLIQLDDNELKRLFRTLKKIFDIKHNNANNYQVYLKLKDFADFRINTKSISFKSSAIDNIYLDTNGDKSLLNFINEEKNYTIVFSKPKYSYIGKYAFSDEQLLTQMNINKILSICKTDHNLLSIGPIESEKSKPGRNSTLTERNNFNALSRFPNQSLFFRVEEFFKDSVLICDDMGNEWADHINITDNCISFIHSKFTKDTYGASAMHEVVSQALKNIGRVHASIDEYEKKFDSKWINNYESTNISRLRKNGNTFSIFSEIKDSLENVYSKTNSKKRIYLATPFFSKNTLQSKLEGMLDNDNPNAHQVQLIWLLSSFITSCQDYGIEPYILCKD